MKYAKIENDNLKIAPRRLKTDEWIIYNPTAKQYKDAGYLPLIETTPPETEPGFYPVPYYVEENTSIMQKWKIEPIEIN